MLGFVVRDILHLQVEKQSLRIENMVGSVEGQYPVGRLMLQSGPELSLLAPPTPQLGQ